VKTVRKGKGKLREEADHEEKEREEVYNQGVKSQIWD